MRPWLLRPPDLLSGRSSDFSGVDRVISAKSATDEPRRPGVVGLYLRIAMFVVLYPDRQPTAVKMSMVPDFRVTMARLVSLRLPVPKRGRRDLPARLSVLTAASFTPKIFSIASLISVFDARGSTRNV